MTDREFTEAEIMKALECCFKKGLLCESCDECPNMAMGSLCMDQMIKDAIDLIERKNAEIERLEALSKHHQTLINMLNEGIAEARAEAVKEFAERVKKKGFTNNFCKLLITAEEVDRIAKEMGVEL